MLHTFLSIVICFLFLSCSSDKQKSITCSRGFYYWKSIYQISHIEKKELKDLNVQKLFIRFFDVDWNDAVAQAVPVGKISIYDSFPVKTVIPVVYITNKTFLKLKITDVPVLATQVWQSLSQIANRNSIVPTELQFDCDWSEKTREKYFFFLKEIRKQVLVSTKLTCTIRLHQIKYFNITGIPPVDRGILMFYNMGKLNGTDEGNSIFNKRDASRYIKSIANYPLQLDVALPIFSWALQIRNGKIINLINKESSFPFKNDSIFEEISTNLFVAKKSFYHKGEYIKKEDIFRIEKLEGDDLLDAAKMISKELSTEPRTIILFDLDRENLLNYEKEILEEVYNCFN